MVYGSTNGNRTFDPKNHVLSNGKTVVNNIIASPIFNPGVNFTQGGTNLGTTQYIDAFQRGNFWKFVHTYTGYHVLLGKPVVLAERSITVPKSLGGVFSNPFGTGVIGTYDINAFDAKLQSYMTYFTQINPGVLPLFVTYDIFLTSADRNCRKLQLYGRSTSLLAVVPATSSESCARRRRSISPMLAAQTNKEPAPKGNGLPEQDKFITPTHWPGQTWDSSFWKA